MTFYTENHVIAPRNFRNDDKNSAVREESGTRESVTGRSLMIHTNVGITALHDVIGLGQ